MRALGVGLFVPLVAWSGGRLQRGLEANARVASDTVTTLSGIKYVIVQHGRGPRPRVGKTATVHYVGTLPNGTKFDSSRDRGEPFEFELGKHEVIDGWEEMIGLMHIGDRVICIIPPQLGYGPKGKPPAIPPNATLIFDIELLATG